MNVKDVVVRVKRTFGDDAGVQITDADIIRWINDAQLQIGMDNQSMLETTVSTNIVQNQAEYASPSNLSVLHSLTYKGFRVKALSFAEFNEYIDGFSSENVNTVYGPGNPEVFMVWQGIIRLFPTPAENVTNGLKIFYVKQPDSVETMADGLTIPLQYHLAVVDYCLQKAYELDEDIEKSSFKQGQFNETMMKLNDRQTWTAQEYYPRITTLPEDENYGDYGFWGGFY